MSRDPGVLDLFYWQEFLLPLLIIIILLPAYVVARYQNKETLQWFASVMLLVALFGSLMYILNAWVYSIETFQGQLFEASVYLSAGKIAYSIGLLFELIIMLPVTVFRRQYDLIADIDPMEGIIVSVVKLFLSVAFGFLIVSFSEIIVPRFSFFGTFSNSDVLQLTIPAISIVVSISVVKISIYGYEEFAEIS